MRRVTARLAVAGAVALLCAGLAAPALADDVDVRVDIPASGAQGRFEVDDAQLRWGLNAESGSGAFFGGCNFLVAGQAGDAGRARVWGEADARGATPLFRAAADRVRVEKPTDDAGWEGLTWANKCTDHSGRAVTAAGGDYGTGVTAVFEGGSGVVDADAGTALIRWQGSATVVFYGGMTYWWLTDPVLTVRADGTGSVTATLGGFGADMFDASRWVALEEVPDVEIATLSGVTFGEDGIVTVPRYEGVPVRTTGGMSRQVTDEPGWGSFPQGFVDFQVLTGQSAYWYTSGGARDFAKPASTMWISYDSSRPTATSPSLQGPPPEGGTGGVPGTGGAGGGVVGAGSALPGVADLADSTDPTVLSPVEWLSSSGLIPDRVAHSLTDPRERVAWAGAAVLTLCSVGFVGFRNGWLILPWTGS